MSESRAGAPRPGERRQRRLYVRGSALDDPATLDAVVEAILNDVVAPDQPADRAPTITSMPSGSRTRATRSPQG